MAKKKAAAYRLAKLSLTLRGISHNLGETNDSRFAHALHKGLYFDYMMQTRLSDFQVGILLCQDFENYDKLPPKQHGLTRCFGGSLLFIQL